MKSYQPGTMGIAEGAALAFGSTFARSFLTAPTVYMQKYEQANWLAILIAGGCTLIVLLLWLKAYQRLPDDLYGMAEQVGGRWFANLIALYYFLAFLASTVTFLRQYAENTLITALPQLDIEVAVGWYMLMAGVLIYFGLEAVARATYLVLPYAVLGVLLVIGLLAPFYNIYFALPWQGKGLETVVPDAALAVGINLGIVGILFTAPSFQNARTLRSIFFYGFGGSVLLRAVMNFVLLLVYGVSVGQEKLLPFYELARLVYINRYLQRIEAMFILLWVIGGILAVSISFYIALFTLARMFKLPAITPLVPLLGIITFHLSLIPGDIMQVIMIDSGQMIYFDIGVYVIPGLVALLVLARKRRTGTCVAE